MLPFPNAQLQVTAEVSGTTRLALKSADTGVQPLRAFVKSACGDATIRTATGNVAVSLHPRLVVMISFGLYDPGEEYRCEGFCNAEVLPSPKFQL